MRLFTRAFEELYTAFDNVGSNVGLYVSTSVFFRALNLLLHARWTLKEKN